MPSLPLRRYRVAQPPGCDTHEPSLDHATTSTHAFCERWLFGRFGSFSIFLSFLKSRNPDKASISPPLGYLPSVAGNNLATALATSPHRHYNISQPGERRKRLISKGFKRHGDVLPTP